MYTLFHDDNVRIMSILHRSDIRVEAIYADCVYELTELSWVKFAVDLLKPNGIIMVQTDYHTVDKHKRMLDILGLTFVNWLIYKQEWGGTPRNRFAQKHDDILVYCKGDEWKWYPERIQIPKATAGTAFDKKGTGLKTPCSVFDDLGNFSTMDKERIKTPEGKNIQWQKPIKLMDRLLLPFTDEQDTVLDPFMGSNTTGVWCKRNNRNFIGIELDDDIFGMAEKRMKDAKSTNPE